MPVHKTNNTTIFLTEIYNNFKFLGAMKPKGLNRIAKIG
jgi:hypothetical protein